MKLFLTSSGVTNKTLEKSLLNLLNKPFSKCSLTFIPTAANVEKGDKSWLINDLNNFRILNFKSIDIVDISAVSKDRWLSSLKVANIIVVGGGNTKYLLDWIRKSKLANHIPELIKNKVYVGISAGSMVTAKTVSLSRSNILHFEKTGKFDSWKGLGFVDFEIRPHLNSDYFPNVRIPYLTELAKNNPATFYAIDDNTAVQVVDGKVSIITEGKWQKFN
ncbi:hypothetical protein A2954_01980 [Candidatus Roizmanbacteria bacterium RIFCSPLOWO2_01_FULL_37_12]|uniref:Peptidase S51 n=1 Tax=Candidatus Roizmanbacteria bacterium RIFCSPLOWO2_01_FULL_37_12 TaxID=1802056 RepID=A0A1F7I9M0_9BACT|nr:MAG: hypothetical protein A2768_01465 [Candidatus Roizmanbacteria bacterium RIFCSPHIGHO2_01_FULL_37_16]OGK23289.1 MAG: hypothetical protein A3D76_00700 [Candidatus Roizmanbacteria bacterium RIFCSPHIGHO2_02_FULL_37_9b]OGK40061.1 MAG: hypothetical protein A2954_01980 [Candidatus Roizmanbacteria bacterium RIFCSPLOWO2_01_FULL_37_12]